MQTKHSSLTAYVYDSDLRIEANRKGENYWYEYVKEVMDQLGLRASGIPRHQLEEDSVLDRIGVLIIGDLNEEKVNRNIAAHLDAWIRRGGILIGFATEGLDSLFGNNYVSTTNQVEDFSISGYFDFKLSPLTSGIHSYLHPDQKLLIFSNIRNMNLQESIEVARLYSTKIGDTGRPAITARDYGLGRGQKISR